VEKHAVHGKIVTDIRRPPKQVIEGFARHDTCKIGDAMAAQGLMNYTIKPISPGMRVWGPAVTVLTRPGDALYVQAVIDLLLPGDVVVIDAGDVRDVSCIGERLSYYMKRRGAAGVVVDGAIRDSRGIIDMGFPCFAKSVCMKIFGSAGPGAINIPIQCGGVPVNPGDIIVGDDDGVVCVPLDSAEQVLHAADEHLAAELDRLRMVEGGATVTEAFGLEEKLKRWR
jgi:4-hydroxy-4-methyl-2-oxoglutarate aldolase